MKFRTSRKTQNSLETDMIKQGQSDVYTIAPRNAEEKRKLEEFLQKEGFYDGD